MIYERTMRTRTLALVLAPGVLLASLGGCVHAVAPRPAVELAVHSVKVGGRSAVVKVEIPPEWRPLVPSEARAEFLAPDGRSRAYIRAMSADVEAKRCPKIARDYARDYIDAWGGPPRTQVKNRVVTGAQVEFELRRTEPKPQGEVIWGRVICRDGVLAITACTLPVQREEQLGATCRSILQSLDIAPASGPNRS